MVVDIKRHICDGHTLKWLLAAGLAWLERHQERVNQLNVFPVPDGDTGTNMRLTLVSAYDAVARQDEPHIGLVGERMAHGALRGARGNSGVILSQLIAGFARSLREHEVMDAALFNRACQSAVDAAYQAVIDPVEGTILTVARDAAQAVNAHVEDSPDLVDAFDHLLAEARESLQRTPELLPILKQSGVIDSGGQGLVFILEGMSRLLHGESIDFDADSFSSDDLSHWQDALLPEDEDGYGYDVQFLMQGTGLDVQKIRAEIDAMGWSTLVVGDEQLIKVHVHVHDPGQPLSYAISTGASIDDVVVENMQAQYEHYVEDRVGRESIDNQAKAEIAVVAVARGEALTRLLQTELHVTKVITGGQTMNPSSEDFLSAIDSLPHEKIILLPNNKNIVMAAKQAATLARDKQVQVIPTTTIPQGISALVSYLDFLESDEMDAVIAAMSDAMEHVTTLEITTATRTTQIDEVDVREGQTIGLIDGRLAAAAEDVETVLHHLIEKVSTDAHEVVTLYYGDDITAQAAQRLVNGLEDTFAALDFVLVAGGQPLYPFIISVE